MPKIFHFSLSFLQKELSFFNKKTLFKRMRKKVKTNEEKN